MEWSPAIVTLPQKVQTALAYMEEYFSQGISLEEVADAVSMCKTRFCRLFKEHTGMTFTHYLNSLKLEEAKRLLLTSHFYVFQVAHKSGFRSANYFGILFKRKFGSSPTGYRDRLRRALRPEMMENC